MKWWSRKAKAPDLSDFGVVSGVCFQPPTPEQQAELERVRRLVNEFYERPEDRQQRMLEEHPELFREVCCEECGQVVPREKDE